MANQQYGDTENWQYVYLPDGSVLITTERECTSADTLDFEVVIAADGGLSIDVSDSISFTQGLD
jgi:hypothetical protein